MAMPPWAGQFNLKTNSDLWSLKKSKETAQLFPINVHRKSNRDLQI